MYAASKGHFAEEEDKKKKKCEDEAARMRTLHGSLDIAILVLIFTSRDH